MTINVQDVITSVRRRLRQTDEANSNWSDADLLVYFNDAAVKLPDSLRIGRKSLEIVGNDATSYPLPSDCIRVEQLFHNGDPMPFLPLAETSIVNDGDPTLLGSWGYTVHGQNLYIFPALSTGATRLLFYKSSFLPVESADTTIALPEQAQLALIFWICMECFLEIKDTSQANVYSMRYEQEIADRRAAESEKQYPSSRAMIPGIE